MMRAVARLMLRSPIGTLGVGLVGFWVIVALLAPWITPFEPFRQIRPLQPPGAAAPGGGIFWLGTDLLGRDILSRLIAGSRTVLFYVPLATLSAYVVGCAMGLTAGYLRGWWDTILSFVGNVILAFPVFVLYVVAISAFGASGLNIVLAVTFASSPAISRIVRAMTLEISELDYVAAARLRGEGPLWIMLFEILPNVRGPLVVDLCLRLGYVTITVGVLGFLGLGLPPPSPDWGSMVNDARSMALVFPHVILAPCIAISSLVLGFNFLADGARELRGRS